MSGLDHQIEHNAGAADRGVDIGGWRIARRRLDETGDDGGFGQVELARRMAEEAARGGIDAIGAAAEIDAVQIKLEYLFLAEAPFHGERQDHFANLAAERARIGQKQVAGELLGNRRSALRPSAAFEPDIE